MVVSLRFRVLVLLGAVITASAVVPSAGAAIRTSVPSPPDVDVASYMVVDYDTGQILAEQDPHRALYPASTLKVLTADTLIPRLDPSREVTPQASDFAAEPDGSVVGMTAGVTYSIADLWRATFVESANDAVAELAHLSGGLGATVAAMQQEARSLGARDTTVVDADGYDQDGQLTSAYDLALFARAGLHIPAFRGYCDLKQTTFPGPKGTTLTLTSHDPMVKAYPGMIGIKGGLTTKAGHTYVGAATRGGHTVIETMMLGGTDVFDQAARLMDWAFEVDGKVAPVGVLGGASGSGSKLSAAPTPTPTPTPTSAQPPKPTPAPSSTTASPTPAGIQSSQSRSAEPVTITFTLRSKSSPITRVDAASRPPWPGAAWYGAAAALAAVAVPVGTRGMHRTRRR
ncbi:D-alanyl-D-alanine carboxypeptidase (penicillin-binding protein 5/6) [Catenulispora sp. GAS73]|uniref:D-alanyl-D-alanine carboxypeptidase family protein n=1 Tax=Catenulispora sp. GAS73 TaxID=3156269 RepID=UPI0035173CDF